MNIKKISSKFNTPAFVAIIILAVAAILAISFVIFTFGYWLITLILAGFFNFILPFSWWYSFGAWLIFLIVGIFIRGGLSLTIDKE